PEGRFGYAKVLDGERPGIPGAISITPSRLAFPLIDAEMSFPLAGLPCNPFRLSDVSGVVPGMDENESFRVECPIQTD
ncbi:MAG: hypothetical protein OXF07_09150, partial [Rhodobacter sp.]|nr:hypothetical protein [Rhodobacter sp.]